MKCIKRDHLREELTMQWELSDARSHIYGIYGREMNVQLTAISHTETVSPQEA